MHDDRTHLARGLAGRTPLLALVRVVDRALRSSLRDRHTLDADREARRIHHDEHGVEAAVLLADEIADRALALLAVLHHGSGARMNAELVLETCGDKVVART